MSKCKKNQRFNENSEFRHAVLNTAVIEVEKRFGRGPSAMTFEGSDFRDNRDAHFAEVMSRRHLGEEEFKNSEKILLQGIEMPEDAVIEPRKRSLEELDQEALDIYRTQVSQALDDLKKQQVAYEHDPESHPFYEKEWNLYWNRKVQEITDRGDDPKTYNFHDEWCAFFVERMKELHKMEVEWKVEQIRLHLGLSVEDVEGIEVGKRLSTPIPSTSGSSQPIPILNSSILSAMKPRVTVIACLRILSNLEAELGLLAPKVLDLMSKTLSADRQKPKSSEELLGIDENLNLFDMVREKLIGLKIACLVPKERIKAVDTGIFDVKTLIEQHEMMTSIKNSLLDMGKKETSSSEITMLMEMIKKKKSEEFADGKVRKRGRKH